MGDVIQTLTSEIQWDVETDVVVAGASVSGFTVAVHSAEAGLRTMLLESADAVGGTGKKAAAWAWLPNNRFMQEKGIADSREDALAYLARFARPALYEEGHPTLGLPEWEYEQFEAFYDNAATALQALEDIGAYSVVHAADYPNYYSHHPADRVGSGRVVLPRLPNGEPGDGIEFTRQMEEASLKRGVDIRTAHTVAGLYCNELGEVVGVRATTPGGELRVRATRAVVFGTGGFSHNEELRRLYLGGLLLPGCSVRTNQGALVGICKRLGVPLLHMSAAYMSPIQLERVIARDPDVWGIFVVPGDSLITVNKHGKRVGNEKTTYNDRTMPHLIFDVERAEYGNFLLFPLWDERTTRLYSGADYGFIPAAGADWSMVARGDTLEELARELNMKLESLGNESRGIRLSADFVATVRQSIARYNEFARTGKDEDFRRGDAPIDRFFHGEPIDNPYPNPTMHPLSDTGPYYSTIIAPSAIETKGGPRTTVHGQILGADDRPVPGLYGVGNCVASPSGQAYLAGGSTFGPFLTYGYLAAQGVVAEPVKEIGAAAVV